MSDRILVPVDVLEGGTVTTAVARFLAPADLLVLGYHEFPEQTTPEQANVQFEDRARDTLAEIAAIFEADAASVATTLAFTNDREQTFDRVASDEGCAAVLIPNPTDVIEDVLVTIHGPVNPARIGSVAGPLLAAADADVTILYVAETMEEASKADGDVARARTVLTDAGVDDGAIDEQREVSGTPTEFVADATTDYDVVVMGKAAASVRSLVFGDPGIRVANESLGPALIVHPPG